MLHEIKLPDVGTVDPTVTVVRWLVQAGQAIERGAPLLEVETDKSIVTIEATVGGILESIEAEEGAEAATGQVVARIKVAADLGDTGTIELRAGARAETIPLLDLYERMVLIREFEEGVKFLFLEGSMPGTIHQCQGQEASAVGVCAALGPDDVITSTFRGHGHALARGLSIEELLDELFGATTGCCRGKGGSMHVGDLDKGMLPGIAIVGGGIPLAAGMALAIKLRKERHVVACFFGDGAVAEGAFHEGVNLAAIWDLPVVFVCENNLYGASTRVDMIMRVPRISARAAAYGIRGETVDGNDVLAVLEASNRAVAECRQGRGPVLLELLTYRRTGHSRRDACHYQPEKERAEWMARDPIEILARTLIDSGAAAPETLAVIKRRIQAQFQTAVEHARSRPLPSLDELATDVYAQGE